MSPIGYAVVGAFIAAVVIFASNTTCKDLGPLGSYCYSSNPVAAVKVK